MLLTRLLSEMEFNLVTLVFVQEVLRLTRYGTSQIRWRRHVQVRGRRVNSDCDILDIRKAFNTVKWSVIAEGLLIMGISEYIMQIH